MPSSNVYQNQIMGLHPAAPSASIQYENAVPTANPIVNNRPWAGFI